KRLSFPPNSRETAPVLRVARRNVMKLRSLVFPALVMFCVACTAQATVGGHGHPGGHVTVPSCSVDADCGSDSACDNGFCLVVVPGSMCSSDADCLPGDACDLTVNECVEGGLGCTSDGDCGAGDICDPGGFCVPGDDTGAGCTSDADCAADESCDP